MAYDIIVLGGGLSGIAAAIRLSHYGKRVLLCERHFRLGGLNSWYERGGMVLDTGLHALTNFVGEDQTTAPLNRVLRQLRLRRSTLELHPQRRSRILFPGTEMCLDNSYDDFTAQVREKFPDDAAGFDALSREILQAGYASEEMPWRSVNAVLETYISSRRLRDILRFPVMYYGNAQAEDMDFSAYATMFRSVLMEGFARPAGGMKAFLGVLEERLAAEGAEVRLGVGAKALRFDAKGQLLGIVDDQGKEIDAPQVLSTIGAVETAALCGDCPANSLASAPAGDIGFLEAIFQAPKAPAEYGFQDAIAFVCRTPEFHFAPPEDAASPESMLVCAPGNYGCCGDEERLVRLSTIVEPADWLALPPEEYRARKLSLSETLRRCLAEVAPALAEDLTLVDAFTPKTVRRWTGRVNGAIYGSPRKFPAFESGVSGLTLAGTDQGLLGITGAMLSGILAANRLLN